MPAFLAPIAAQGAKLVGRKLGGWIKNLATKGFNLAKKDGASWLNKNFKLSGRGANELGISNVPTQKIGGESSLLKYAAIGIAAFTLFK